MSNMKCGCKGKCPPAAPDSGDDPKPLPSLWLAYTEVRLERDALRAEVERLRRLGFA